MDFTEHEIVGTGKIIHRQIEGYRPRVDAHVFYDCRIPINSNGEIQIELTKILRQDEKDVIVFKILFSYQLPQVQRAYIDAEISQFIELSIADIDKQISEEINKVMPHPVDRPFKLSKTDTSVIQQLVQLGRS